MKSLKFRTGLQVILLALMVAISLPQNSVAQTPKQMLALIKSSQILADKRPVASLSDRKLAKQRKTLTRFINSPLGEPDLKRRASARLVQINFEIRRRQIVKARAKVRANATGTKKIPNLVVAPSPIRPALRPPVLADRRPSASLATPQLRQRLRTLRKIIADRTVGPRLLRRARTMRKADRAELQIRKDRANQPRRPNFLAVLRDKRPPASLAMPQLRQRIRALTKAIALTASNPKQRRRARRMYAADIRELKIRSRVVRPVQTPPELIAALSDRRPSQSLSRRGLKRRIDKLAGLINDPRLNKRQRRTLKARYARDVAELNRRRALTPQLGPGNLAVLADRRPAGRLNGAQLRARVAALRNALGRRDLTRVTRRQLSRKLTADRSELRRRVAERRARNAGNVLAPLVPNRAPVKISEQARRLLTDFRASRALNKRQLNRRIASARTVLKYLALTRAQRVSLRNMIKLDRAEKRRRLLAARARRQAELERLRLRGQLRIDINPRFDRPPYGNDSRRRDLAAAEADEGMIERQFYAPENRTFNRRYSREEISRRPELTRSFAGIDVDTVNFGFNEYWVREEEVDKLERMAITIERILAARPYEVFQIEGHTDAVGSDAYNLKLSRQRALAVKQALTKFFVIPARALVTVGLGERYLKIPTLDAEPENRRVTIRRITPIVER